MWDAAVDVAAALERALAGARRRRGRRAARLARARRGPAPRQPGDPRPRLVRARAHAPRTAIRGLRRRDAIAAWVAGAGAGGLRVRARRRRRARARCCAPAARRRGLPAAGRHARGRGRRGARRRRWSSSRSPSRVGRRPAARRRRRRRRLRGRCRAPGRSPPLARRRRRAARPRACAASPRRRRRRGCAPLRSPGAYARAVLPWQLASRACRLGALACFLAAFGAAGHAGGRCCSSLFAQGGGRLVPFAPASVGAGRRDARGELRARHRQRGARPSAWRRSSSARARC